MTFNAASRLRSLEDRSAALGSSRCELPGMHSVPKSAVLPYASGVGGLRRRLLNTIPYNIKLILYDMQNKDPISSFQGTPNLCLPPWRRGPPPIGHRALRPESQDVVDEA